MTGVQNRGLRGAREQKQQMILNVVKLVKGNMFSLKVHVTFDFFSLSLNLSKCCEFLYVTIKTLIMILSIKADVVSVLIKQNQSHVPMH